jgi:membrane protease YdiL (CAAX protease family)
MFRRIHEALRPANAFDAVLSVLAIAAAPAVFEETLVRGVVLPSFRPALGATGAVLASALLFALMHADLYRLLFTFAVGAVLGVVRLRAAALLPCILVHATLNTLTFLAAPLVDDPSEPLPDPRPLLGAALLALGMAVTALLLRRLPRER